MEEIFNKTARTIGLVIIFLVICAPISLFGGWALMLAVGVLSHRFGWNIYPNLWESSLLVYVYRAVLLPGDRSKMTP